MGGSFRETERKYEVKRGFRLPTLGEAPGVATVSKAKIFELDAVYYDTVDFRLARRKITLRRREGGGDEGWHLKLPVAADTRDEIRRPLGDSVDGGGEVPAEFVDLVQAHLRGAELLPVARLRTVRTARRLRDATGDDLVEVVDDAVSAYAPVDAARPARWREVEVELAGGRPDLLAEVGDRLVAAGACPARNDSKLARALGPALTAATVLTAPAARELDRDTSAGEVIRRYLQGQLDALLAADPRVRLDEPDSVHRMRVASRRLRSTLGTYERLFDADRARALESELRDLASSLSGARDTEVLLEHFTAELADLPPEFVLGPVAERIHGHLRAGLADSRHEVLATLRGDRYHRLVDDLEAFLAEPTRPGRAARPAGDVLPTLVRKADRRLARRVARIEAADRGQPRDEAHHSARKQAKRLRYAAEAVVGVFGRDARALAGAAEQAQEVLGIHQDATVARGLLGDWGTEAQRAGDDTAFTLGLLLGRENCRAATAERDFAEVWNEVSRPRHRRWLGE